MKEKLKVGDRVSVYGIAFEETLCEGLWGTVDRVDDGGWIYVRPDNHEDFGRKPERFHPKQCRRLIPAKPRRRVWIDKSWLGEDSRWTNPTARKYPPPYTDSDAKGYEFVEFIEVRKPK